MRDKEIRTLGLILAVPMMVFAVHENYWAEPLPPKMQVVEPAFTVTIEQKGDDAENIESIEETKKETDQPENNEIDLLARCVEAEAGNQSILGKRLVVDTILNRVDSEDFPDSISEVIEQPGQFGVVENGSINKVDPTKDTYEAIALEKENRISKEVMFFQAGKYSQFGNPFERVGDHYFSTKGD